METPLAFCVRDHIKVFIETLSGNSHKCILCFIMLIFNTLNFSALNGAFTIF